ncbi:hypothetical protein F4777DRAFT_593571 [Nemania sp. FL0916]|nr:hypothetical protein F4777DRAFT_593571 [Nemania sp. FL0916]
MDSPNDAISALALATRALATRVLKRGKKKEKRKERRRRKLQKRNERQHQHHHEEQAPIIESIEQDDDYDEVDAVNQDADPERLLTSSPTFRGSTTFEAISHLLGSPASPSLPQSPAPLLRSASELATLEREGNSDGYYTPTGISNAMATPYAFNDAESLITQRTPCAIPCTNCLQSAIASSSDVQCYEAAGPGSHCTHCASEDVCQPLDRHVVPMATRLMTALRLRHPHYIIIQLRQACSALLNIPEADFYLEAYGNGDRTVITA